MAMKKVDWMVHLKAMKKVDQTAIYNDDVYDIDIDGNNTCDVGDDTGCFDGYL